MKPFWKLTKQTGLGVIRPPVSPSPGFCGGHMWVALSTPTSLVDFFLLSLQSKYYSVARVGRHHQEQEVKKASRAAVSPQSWSSRFKPWSKVYVQLCLMLPFSEWLMILQQNGSSFEFDIIQLAWSVFIGCVLGASKVFFFFFCHLPFSPCIHGFIYYKIIIHMELLGFVLFFDIGFSV